MAKKKRYHQSYKDRMNESVAMKHSGYAVNHPMSHRLSGMVHEDFSKPSNLPTNVIMKEYPKTNSVYQNYDYDTLEDANACIDMSARQAAKSRKGHSRY